MISFTPSMNLRSEPAFLAEDVVRGVLPDPRWAYEAGRIWVEVDNRPEAMRVFGALAGVEEAVPLVFLEGDAVSRGNHVRNDIVVGDWYTRLTPFSVQAEAEQIAAAFRRPFINLARPGVFGSSGSHGERRREREVKLIDAALARLMDAFGWLRFDIAGQSGGGHLVAALIARRSDIRCAVIASGNVAVRQRNEARGMNTDATGYADFVDPIDLVSEVAQHPPSKIIVLTDPADSVVAAEHQFSYVERLLETGVAVEQRTVPAFDPNHHILRYPAMFAAASAF